MPSTPFNWKLLSSGITAAVVAVIAILANWLIANDASTRSLSFAILAFGVALGWLLGILASPYDSSEQRRFSELGKTLSVFVSGYLIAKVDGIVDVIAAPDRVTQPLSAVRLLGFGSLLVVTAVITFVYRQYATIEVDSAA